MWAAPSLKPGWACPVAHGRSGGAGGGLRARTADGPGRLLSLPGLPLLHYGRTAA